MRSTYRRTRHTAPENPTQAAQRETGLTLQTTPRVEQQDRCQKRRHDQGIGMYPTLYPTRVKMYPAMYPTPENGLGADWSFGQARRHRESSSSRQVGKALLLQ
jgi:hypothetical protein